MKPDRHAGQKDPIHGEKPSIVCKDCGQVFTTYYYRMHRGPDYNELCPSTAPGYDGVRFGEGGHQMKVEELIAHLQKFDPNLVVETSRPNENYAYATITEVSRFGNRVYLESYTAEELGDDYFIEPYEDEE